MCSTSFFKEHKEVLTRYYPGINETIFTQFLSDLKKQNIDFNSIQAQLLNARPLEYILGQAFFYSINLKVNEDVLIPRFETELLFDLARGEINKRQNPKVIDVGCGPGTIILALMKEANAFQAFASDISIKATNLTKENFNLLQNELKTKELQLLNIDRLSNIETKFDIIISNPPYIKESADLPQVHQSVEKHEPRLALYISDNEYDQWFLTFFKQAFSSLADGGVFIMESHENHLTKQKEMAQSQGFNKVEILKDLTNRDRFLLMEKTNG